MINGIRSIGQVLLQSNSTFLEQLVDTKLVDTKYVRSEEEKYIVVLDIDSATITLSINLLEADEERVKHILWVGNASSNDDQDRLTTDNIGYLASQTIPNLLKPGRLPDGELRKKLEILLKELYLDLGEKENLLEKNEDIQYERYRRFWNLLKLGINDPDLIPPSSEKIKEIKVERGVFSIDFFKEYLKRTRESKKIIELIKKILENYILKINNLNKKQLVLYTLSIDGQLLVRHPDYIKYLERRFLKDIFDNSIEGVCHICGSYREVSDNTKYFRMMKFYNKDKIGFAGNLDQKEGFFKRYSICRECYSNLLAGERFVENKLSTRLAYTTVHLIPEFYLPICTEGKELERWADYLKNRISAIETLDGWKEFQDHLDDYRYYEDNKAAFIINFLFTERRQSESRILKLIPDVPPSRLDRLDDERNSVRIFADSHLGQRNSWDLSLRRILYLFPIEKGRDGIKIGVFLEFLDVLLNFRGLEERYIVKQLLETSRIHRLEQYGNHIHSAKDSDMELVIHLLLSNLFIRYLRGLGVLKDDRRKEEYVVEEWELLDANLKEYIDGIGLNSSEKALFLLGYLVGKVATEQYRVSKNKPILNKINFQGMDENKVIRLSNEIYEKLRQSRIADYNEGTYATMKSLLDRKRKQGALMSPQENAYWILSGYAYANWQAIRYGAGKNKEKEEI